MFFVAKGKGSLLNCEPFCRARAVLLSPRMSAANRNVKLTDEEVRAFIESFDSIGDAFFFVGASTTQQVLERARESAAPVSETVPAAPSPPAIGFRNRIVVFDTETTGLSPAIACQLAYVVIQNGAIVTESDSILKLPRGVSIQRRAQEVHKISNARCEQEGVDAPTALSQFLCLCRQVRAEGGLIVAHNASFDVRALRETCERWDVYDDLEKEHCFCTMQQSRHFSPLLAKNGKVKAFSNEELYQYFYNTKPTWARLHDALDDVKVTAFNLTAGVSRGVFRIC